MTITRAPADLDTAGRKLWRDILRTHDLDGRELAILHEAARQADTLDALAKVLASGATRPPAAQDNSGFTLR